MTDSKFKEKLKDLFEEHCESLKRFAWYKVGNEGIADDLVQDAFVKLWNKRARVNWETPVGLLYKMISNMAMDHHKHRKVVLEFEDQSNADHQANSPEFELEYSQFQKQLEDCISNLPDGSRQAFLMNRIESLRYREIADKLQISVKAIEKRMTLAIKSLTSCVGQKI